MSLRAVGGQPTKVPEQISPLIVRTGESSLNCPETVVCAKTYVKQAVSPQRPPTWPPNSVGFDLT